MSLGTVLIDTFEMCQRVPSPVTHLKLDESIKGIGAYAFYNSDVTKINIPASVKYIGDYAFGSSKLKKITIPVTVEEFGEKIFAYSDLSSITFEEGMEKIPDTICDSCNSLKKAVFPSSIKVIGKGAFYNCKTKKFVIPERITNVGNMAFFDDIQTSKGSEIIVMGDTKGYDDRFYGGKTSATFEKGLKYAKFGIWWSMYYNQPDAKGNIPVGCVWNKVNRADGYEIEGSVNENFSNSVKTETTETEVRLNIKAGSGKATALYVRVRAFKNLDDKGKREYSEWNNMVLQL